MQVEALSQINYGKTIYQAGDVFAVDDASGNVLIDTHSALFHSWDEPQDDAPAPGVTPTTMWEMSRADLNEFARTLGVNPDAFGSRSEVMTAIQAIQSGAITAPSAPAVIPEEEAPAAPDEVAVTEPTGEVTQPDVPLEVTPDSPDDQAPEDNPEV